MKHILPMMMAALIAFSITCFAQVAGLSTIEYKDYYTSGTHTQTGPEIGSVHRKVFTYNGAASLRVVFGAFTLGANDWIEVYSPTTGERHKLNNAELTKWQGTSGFFNGDTLWIDLYLAPGSTGSFDIISYFVGLGGLSNGRHTICGNDDRVQSTDNRSGRFVVNGSVTGGGCTIWLASNDGCAISAGHCFSGGSLMLAEFNVPASLPSGALQHPPISDQFPIDPATVSFTNGGVGNDWGVCKLFNNNLGQSAASLYGFYNVVSTVPAINDTIRITGYGVDSGVDNQTNQTNTGPLVGNSGTTLGYQVDTQGGNSGSPVIHESTGNAVGIHTHGGCTSSNTGNNSGTSTSHSGFQSAFTALCNQAPQPPTASFTTSTTTIVAGQSVTFTDTSTGAPTSWAWDLDGDNVTDATTAITTFQYNTPGVYDVTLTVTNAQGSDTITMTALVTVNGVTIATLPYSQDFTGGLPATGEWVFQSMGATGQIQASSYGSASPLSGSPSLVMDSSVNGSYATNEAILFVDLASTNGGMITYWFKETNDEPDPEDGLFLSDGVNEILLQDHGNGPQVWTEFIIDITAAANAAGMTLTNNMQLIFRQRDNYNIGTDGHLIDDISIIAPPSADTGQPNTAQASLVAAGMVDKDGFIPTAGQNGPFFVTHNYGDVMSLQMQGPPGGYMILLAGPLNRNNVNFVGAGQLDIGMLGYGNYTDLTVIIDGVNPTTLYDSFGVLTPAGTQLFSAYITPALPVGVAFTMQALMFPNIKFTAAIQLTVQ